MNQPKPKPTVDLGYPIEAHGRIPSFSNVEEKAAFWDSHDFTDFAEESSPVQITIGPDLAERQRLERATDAGAGSRYTLTLADQRPARAVVFLGSPNSGLLHSLHTSTGEPWCCNSKLLKPSA